MRVLNNTARPSASFARQTVGYFPNPGALSAAGMFLVVGV
jgi:hypothetical protein